MAIMNTRQPLPIEWQNRAECRRATDPELFYPLRGSRDLTVIKKFCRRCPVRIDCLEYALSFGCDSQFGVWGGMSPRRRKAILRQRKQRAIS